MLEIATTPNLLYVKRVRIAAAATTESAVRCHASAVRSLPIEGSVSEVIYN